MAESCFEAVLEEIPQSSLTRLLRNDIQGDTAFLSIKHISLFCVILELMKKLTLSFFMLACFCANIFAQQTIIAAIDTSFHHGGKLELSLSGNGDEVTDFFGVFPDKNLETKATVCGKIGTADPLRKKIGLVRVTVKNGTFDSLFGTNGIEI